jgi:transmembrane sensor
VKDYLHFSVNDFVLDDYFRSWILNPDENNNAFWASWLAEHPEKTNHVKEARTLLGHFKPLPYTLSPENVSEIWGRIQQGNAHARNQHQTSVAKTYRWHWAAAAILLIGIGLYLIPIGQDRQEYRTAFGETKTIVLPDSSTVILNANSRLAFDKNWEQRAAREIWLDGEAYFSVVHKQDHQPFKVSTPGGIAVEVLGTTFNVYHRAVETKVVLNTGQITLSFPVDKKEKKILMKPGELVECQKDNYTMRVVDPRVYAAWTEKKIILDQTTLREMIRMAKDNYGVEIGVETEKMLAKTVSGSMPIGNAENFVKQVASVFQLKVVRENDTYLFKE